MLPHFHPLFIAFHSVGNRVAHLWGILWESRGESCGNLLGNPVAIHHDFAGNKIPSREDTSLDIKTDSLTSSDPVRSGSGSGPWGGGGSPALARAV